MLEAQLAQHMQEEQRLHQQTELLQKERICEREEAHNVAQVGA